MSEKSQATQGRPVIIGQTKDSRVGMKFDDGTVIEMPVDSAEKFAIHILAVTYKIRQQGGH